MGKWSFLQLGDKRVLEALTAGETERAFEALVHGYQR